MNNDDQVWDFDAIAKHDDAGVQRVLDAFCEMHQEIKSQVPLVMFSINSTHLAGGQICDIQLPYEKRGELLSLTAATLIDNTNMLGLEISVGDPDNDQLTGQVLFNHTIPLNDIRGGLTGKYDILETCWNALSEHVRLKPPMAC